MSDYCSCCGTNEEYVREHLNWNVVDAHGPDAVAEFTDKDWLREAKECKDWWEWRGAPLKMTVEELAGLLETVFGV